MTLLKLNTPGEKEVLSWIGKFPNAKWLPQIGGKNPSEMYQNGESLIEWFEGGIAYYLKLEKRGEPLEQDQTERLEDFPFDKTEPEEHQRSESISLHDTIETEPIDFRHDHDFFEDWPPTKNLILKFLKMKMIK